ncbi:DcuS/MalK family sensor histidine kinase [Salmonella enterica subsp. enterica serovar Winslow]
MQPAKLFSHMPLRLQIILLVIVVLILPLIAANIRISHDIDEKFHHYAGQKAENIARVVAESPIVIDGLENPVAGSQQKMQQYTQEIQEVTDVEFIVILDMQGLRLVHPDVDKIGKPMEGGDGDRVLHGQTYLSSARGSLGLSLRAFRPVINAKHQQTGAVVVGLMSSNISRSVAQVNQPIMSALTLALLVGIALAVVLANSIKKILFGLEPVAISRLLEERNALLESVREGILAIDQDARLTVINSEAKRILKLAGIPTDILGHKVDEFIPQTRLPEILVSGEPELDYELDINGISILTNRVPLYVNGVISGAIATFRDMSEVRQMAEELTGVNRYVEALRSSAHEFLNKLHVINGLAHSNHHHALTTYLAEIIHDNQDEQETVHQVVSDPVLAAFLVSKFSRARELGVRFTLDISEPLPEIGDPKIAHHLVTLLGNLIDNGLDAVQTMENKEVTLRIAVFNDDWEMEIIDTGPGMSSEKIPEIFRRGYSTKGENRGIGLFLVSAVLDKLNGSMDVSGHPGQGMHFLIKIPLTMISGKHND